MKGGKEQWMDGIPGRGDSISQKRQLGKKQECIGNENILTQVDQGEANKSLWPSPAFVFIWPMI